MATPNEVRPPVVALDLIRGLAALTVLMAHLRGDSFVEYGALPVSQHGALTIFFFATTRFAFEAVMVFFVLSGFLVGGQVLARCRQHRFQIYDYINDRSSRILIPLVPACLFAVAVEFFLFDHAPPAVRVIANMVGLNEIVVPSLDTNPVLWSLSYEIWFYIFAGGLAYAVNQRPNAASIFVIAACVVVFTILKVEYLAFWLLGAFASLIVQINFKRTLFLLGMCSLIAGSLFYQLAAESRSVTPVIYIQPVMSEFLMCIGIALALPFLASSFVNRLLLRIGPIASALAGFSYTLYLTHRPTDAILGRIFGKADALSNQALFYFGLRISICLAIAILFYYCFERNTPIVRKYLRSKTLWMRKA